MHRRHPLHFYLVYAGVVIIMFIKHFRILMDPWISGSMPFTFRSDNFFNFSSGHIRRGLVGELLYQSQRLGLDSIFIYSSLLLVLLAFCYVYLMPRIMQNFSTVQAYIITFSSLVLSPGLDREVIILLPALYLYFRRENDSVFNILLLLTTFVHEIAFLIYLPLVIQQWTNHSKSGRILRVATNLLYLAAASTIIFYRPTPNFMAELSFWPQYGVENLLDRFLYAFADMAFIDLVKKHGYILVYSSETLSALIGLCSFLLIALVCLKRFGASTLTALYYFCFNVVFFLLTVDYGRYFYLLFILYMLLGQSSAINRVNQLFAPFERLLPSNLRGRLEFTWLEKNLTVVLIIFALSPFGYWVGDTKFTPAVYQEIEQLVDFKLPKHAGE